MGDAQVPYRDRTVWWILARMERGGHSDSPGLQHGAAALSPAFLRAQIRGVCFWRLRFGVADPRVEAGHRSGLEKRPPLPFPLTTSSLRSSQTSWTPGWMLEDGVLGQGAVLASEDAQACDICQEIFPPDTASQADYLKHVLAHMK